MSPEISNTSRRTTTKEKIFRPVAAAILAGIILYPSKDTQSMDNFDQSVDPDIGVSPLNTEGITEMEVNKFQSFNPINIQKEGPPAPDPISSDEITYAFQIAELERIKSMEESSMAKLSDLQSEGVAASAVDSSVKVPTSSESLFFVLADCETGDGQVGPPFSIQWDYDGPSGFDGPIQYLPSTWSSLEAGKEYEFAWQAPPEVQIKAFEELLARGGWGQWPGCSKIMRSEGYIE